jgi:hypothetical protein
VFHDHHKAIPRQNPEICY